MTVYITATASIRSDQDVPPALAREMRRADPFIKFAALAAHALQRSRNEGVCFSEDCGLFCGTAFGPMETNFDVLDQVVNKTQTSPTLFSHSVFNAAAGYLARIFNLHGGALTITDFSLPFFQALQQALIAIESKQLSNCVVLQVETYSQLLDDARLSSAESNQFPWNKGSCAWLLSNCPAPAPCWRIDSFSLSATQANPSHHLDIAEHLKTNDTTIQLTTPLDAVMHITELLHNTSAMKECCCSLTASYGTMSLAVSLYQ